ncbi:effector-binding domain-containing protein [Aequitasia blattaphilus]|uniref:GyrI-like domain-containing protein n=1 Tax=Aequitasia blattaphilus TaxID=2949332 RepID=A0ABT1E4P0_9FIRM|nr:GyrI-like domain-containing protein [Aequitasia blattaphilus]MCP1100804.1 GyrI-like domain-containing protein [Aequitasia blattaphilus]MCR8613444.1 GyrI-like domain-containing protein [Aequitasia blattaphilus]
MNYEIEVRDIEPIRVAYIRYQGIAIEANKVFPKVFQSVRGKTNGAPFFSYLFMNPESRIGEMELCVPTAEIPVGNGIEVKEMPRIKAVCVTHIGSYETLNNAYAEIDRYTAENGLQLMPPFREVFIKGPGMMLKGNPEKYVTEILFPIQEG